MVPNGGFVAREVQTTIAYDVLGEMQDTSLPEGAWERMQATEGQYWGHRVVLQAATDGGPLNRMFKIGSREISMREQYTVEQASQMCGRLGAKLEQLNERHWNLMSKMIVGGSRHGREGNGTVSRNVGSAIMRRDYPDRPQAM